MGIRFYCPNGHYLNVKTFLAGKRGVCPHCNAPVEIPFESDPKAAAEEPSVVIPGPPAVAEPADDDPTASAASRLTGGPPRPAGARGPGRDPLADAPAAAWYIRTPQGQQFGPAQAKAVRRWLADGRINSETLVWREGWSDWRLARDVFPNLGAPPPPPASPAPPSRVAATAARRRRSRDVAVAAVIGLGLTAVILLAALIYVLTHQP